MRQYRLERALGGYERPPQWGEWASWWVLDGDDAPIGFVWEHRNLVSHSTWGPATYVTSHNPIDDTRVGRTHLAR